MNNEIIRAAVSENIKNKKREKARRKVRRKAARKLLKGGRVNARRKKTTSTPPVGTPGHKRKVRENES